MATQKGRNWSSGDIVTAANLSSVERGVSAVSSSYEPTTWANGDTVTAAALNNIEQGIVNADGGSATWVTLCEEEIITEDMDGVYGAFLSYSQLIFADTIRVTFDGNEYMCNVNNMEELYVYGGFSQAGPDFSEYPFVIVSTSQAEEDVNQIITETSGTHTVKIEVLQDSTSGDFSTAVVIVVNADTNTIWDNCPALDLEDNILIGGFYPDSSRMTVLVPLYKGKCYWDISSQGLALVGNVTQHSHGLLITGDCTITASGESGS